MPPTFADLGVPPRSRRRARTRGITTPFPIQAATLPDALAGRDVSGRAPTGSGKTMAFGVPLVAAGSGRARAPPALVLVPTRELAAQICQNCAPLPRPKRPWRRGRLRRRRLRPAAASAGPRGRHRVACPGRLEDLIQQRGSTSVTSTSS